MTSYVLENELGDWEVDPCELRDVNQIRWAHSSFRCVESSWREGAGATMDFLWLWVSYRLELSCPRVETEQQGPASSGLSLQQGSASCLGSEFPLFRGVGGCEPPCPPAAACTPTTCSVTATWPGSRSG